MTIQEKINAAKMSGGIVVTASAGTGKTYSIVNKIQDCLDKGINPLNILVFTFTVDAANALKNRIQNGQLMTVGTIHSVMFQIIRENSPKRYFVLDNGAQTKFVFNIFKENRIEYDRYNNYMSKIGFAKNYFTNYYDLLENDPEVLIEFFKDQKLFSFAMQYEAEKERQHKIDFDDMTLKAYAILRNNPEVLAHRQERWKYIFVDEAQDLCPPQIDIIKLLAAKYQNLFIVGDEKQAIYASFRASTPEFLQNFKHYYPQATQFFLPTTYRCAKAITLAGNKIAQFIDKTTIDTANKEPGIINKIVPYETQAEEAECICDMAIDVYQNTDQSIRILYRTNAQSLMFQLMLIRQNVPFSINQNVSIFNTKEGRLAIACCQLAMEYESMSTIAKTNVLNNIRPALNERKQVYNAVGKMRDTGKDLMKDELGEQFEDLMYDVQALQMAVQMCKNPTDIVAYVSKMPCIADFSDSAPDNLIGISEFLRGCKTMKEVDAMIAEVSRPRDVPKDERVIHLSTIHGSKGLEADVVFLTGVSDNVLPHKFGIPEEELNLFYVGVTRARNILHVSGFRHFGTNEYTSHRYMEII
jgi:DNA helicase II / ATP-dependent DNA helicase PcrA